MRLTPLLLIPLIAVPIHAAELAIKNLHTPIYDESGLLVRTLSAASAEGPLDKPLLKNGGLEFHVTSGAMVGPGAKLAFAEATFDKAASRISGPSVVKFYSAECDLAGEGFDYDLTTGKLNLHARVVSHYQGVRIDGRTAEAVIRQNPETKVWTLDDAVIRGNVVATDIVIGKLRFDRAETDHATYSATAGTITLASPVTTWRAGEKNVIGGELIQIQLKDVVPAATVYPTGQTAAPAPSSP